MLLRRACDRFAVFLAGAFAVPREFTVFFCTDFFIGPFLLLEYAGITILSL